MVTDWRTVRNSPTSCNNQNTPLSLTTVAAEPTSAGIRPLGRASRLAVTEQPCMNPAWNLVTVTERAAVYRKITARCILQAPAGNGQGEGHGHLNCF